MRRSKLTVNQVLSKTRRRKGEQVPRFQFGPPKTEKSRRTIDFPEFLGNHPKPANDNQLKTGQRAS